MAMSAKRASMQWRASIANLPPPPTWTVQLPRGGPSVTFEWSLTGQHTLTWRESVKVKKDGIVTTLGAGSCNLYMFPCVAFAKSTAVKAEPQTGGRLEVLSQMLTAIAQQYEEELFGKPDSSGATPILGLFVANTPQAIELCLSIYRVVPKLLAESHHPGPFLGENAFHIAAVNCREDALCDMVEIAHTHLEPELLHETLTSQAAGGFFSALPTAHYGGTPLAYACAFCLRRAVALYLSLSTRSTKLDSSTVSVNDPRRACTLTGFLPLHAVVANGHRAMYDFLVELPELPSLHECRASESALAQAGTFAQMTPLQLAARLGDHTMAKHIFMRRAEVVWKWGPITQYKIVLDGVDSTGGGGNDIMEIIGRLDASKQTREMLLDSFLNGFIHGLFVTKWRRFGRVYHCILRFFELTFILSIAILAIWLKESPDTCLQQKWLPWVVLATAIPMLEEDARSVVLFWSKIRTTILHADANEEENTNVRSSLAVSSRPSAVGLLEKKKTPLRPLKVDLHRTLRWAQSHLILSKLVGAMLAAAGAIALILGFRPLGASAPLGDYNATEMVVSEFGLVEASSSTAADDRYFPIWAILAISLLIELQAFFAYALVPMRRLGVFMHTSVKMIMHDITMYVALFMVFFATYGLSMYVCYPRAGDHMQKYAPNFNSQMGAFHELIELALTGEPIKISQLDGMPVNREGWVDLISKASLGLNGEEISDPMSTAEMIELGLFIVLYFTYVLLMLILLLNLLIASMNNTFLSMQEASVLEWRVLYARNLLRLEMLAEPFAKCHLCTTNGGQFEGGRWYYFTKSYANIVDEADDENDEMGGGKGDAFGGDEGEQEKRALAMAVAVYGSGSSSSDASLAARRIQKHYRRRRMARAEEMGKRQYSPGGTMKVGIARSRTPSPISSHRNYSRSDGYSPQKGSGGSLSRSDGYAMKTASKSPSPQKPNQVFWAREMSPKPSSAPERLEAETNANSNGNGTEGIGSWLSSFRFTEAEKDLRPEEVDVPSSPDPFMDALNRERVSRRSQGGGGGGSSRQRSVTSDGYEKASSAQGAGVSSNRLNASDGYAAAKSRIVPGSRPNSRRRQQPAANKADYKGFGELEA